jgi:hypothetical protein
MKWYQAGRIAEEVNILSECAAMLRYTYIAYLVFSLGKSKVNISNYLCIYLHT